LRKRWRPARARRSGGRQSAARIYAAFHVASDLFQSLGFKVPKADRAHGYLHLRLSNSGNDDMIDAGRISAELRSRRNRADYDKRSRFSTADAQDALEMAHSVIAMLDEALSEPLRSDITSAIKIYERDVLKEVTWQA
jgi:hypothetical protein